MPNNSYTIHEAKLMELKWQIDNVTIVVQNFYILSAIDRTTRQKRVNA